MPANGDKNKQIDKENNQEEPLILTHKFNKLFSKFRKLQGIKKESRNQSGGF